MCDQHDAKTASMDMSTLIGYTRVSTAEQSLEMQINVLRKTGCHQVLTNVASEAKADRPDLDKALEYLRDGDTLAVWKIGHLGHSLVHLVQTIDTLCERGIGFQSLADAGIDTTACDGKLLFNLFATLVEFERDLISERTKASLAVAKVRGRNGGRRAAITPKKLTKARRLMDKKGLAVKEAAAALDIGRSTLYRVSNAECDAPMGGDGQGGPKAPRSLAY